MGILRLSAQPPARRRRLGRWLRTAIAAGSIAAGVGALGLPGGAAGKEAAPEDAPSSQLTLEPRLEATLQVDRDDAAPGDAVTYDIHVRHSGATLSAGTLLNVHNSTGAPLSLAGYQAHFEYRSVQSGQWVALAGMQRLRDGYHARLNPPISTGLSIAATPRPADGAIYPVADDKLLEAQLAGGATGSWDVRLRAQLSSQELELVRDPARAREVRAVLRTEIAAAGETHREDGETVTLSLTDELRDAPAAIDDVAAVLSLPEGRGERRFDAAGDSRLARLDPGEDVALGATEALAIDSAPHLGEPHDAYLTRLAALDGEVLASELRVTGRAGVAGLSAVRTASVTRRLPVLSLDKTGPISTNPGTSAIYHFSLRNDGGAAARPALTDAIDGAPSRTVPIDELVAPGTESTGQVGFDVPDDRAPGPLSDLARLTWTDSNDNPYGPLTDAFTTQVQTVSAPAPGPSDPPAANPVGEAPDMPPDTAIAFEHQTSFLYDGADPIQKDVTAQISATRVAVLRGRVITRDGDPIGGVRVSVHDHPELGHTESRTDGGYDIAVNGGGTLTLDLQRAGFIVAQRQVEAPWQDYASVDTVVLLPYEEASTTINLDAPAMQAVQSAAVSDSDGARAATLLVPEGADATMRMPDGSSEPLDGNIRVRATEYTVGAHGPAAMPGPLPPTSGYTYAVEYSVDQAVRAGATQVSFDKPIISYVENFLELPVGNPVPAGWYDRDKAAWVASDDGLVIEVVSETDGLARVDLDGDGQADSSQALTNAGITDDELGNLAALYEPGQSLWRVAIDHFTPWDFNYPEGPPDGAVGPDGKPVGSPDSQCEEGGSIIGCEDQSLGEEIGVQGTPYALRYDSRRVPGRTATRTLEIPVTGATLPDSVKAIELTIEIAGRRTVRTFAPQRNLRSTFTWDGKDAYGRTMTGGQQANVSVKYVYPSVRYRSVGEFQRSFALVGSGVAIGRGRGDIDLTDNYQRPLGGGDAAGIGLGGWTLTAHHVYDPGTKTLYYGDGAKRTVDGSLTLETMAAVAGTGVAGADASTVATQSALNAPSGIAFAPDGSLYVADTDNDRVRRVRPDGTVATVAGNGTFGSTGDGGPATEARLGLPRAVTIGPDGSLYIADYASNRVRRVSPTGVIDTVAGGGAPADGIGDGGLATAARLRGPSGVAVAPDGTLYLSERNAHRVRRVGTDGFIQTLAGDGTSGLSGDTGPAAGSRLRVPEGLALGAAGELYVADSANRRVRRIGADGVISTVAGGGSPATGIGDGGQAGAARLERPVAVSTGPDGLYVADADQRRVRVVAADGTISTLVGGGTSDANGRPGAATRLADLGGVAIDAAGRVNVAEAGAHRVRRQIPELQSFSADDVLIPSQDGAEIYQFNGNGRHERTLDALTAIAIETFAYDSAGRLSEIVDDEGKTTTIERDAAGAPVAILAPYGQRTQLTTGADGFLSAVSNAAGETVRATYDPGGLLRSFRDPLGHATTFEFDELGRLTHDTDPTGASKSPVRTDPDASTLESTFTTAQGRTTVNRVTRTADGAIRRSSVDSAGREGSIVSRRDGSADVVGGDGSRLSAMKAPDPRFGMLAPFAASGSLTTPSGRHTATTTARTTTLTQPGNPLGVQRATSQTTTNGRTRESLVQRTAEGWTGTSTNPSGRSSSAFGDARGRVLRTTQPTRLDVNTTYDSDGRPSGITQGDRVTRFDYDAQGQLAQVTDPLGRVTVFDYDAADRLSAQTGPDGRTATFEHDDNGQLTAFTPAGRSAHRFEYDARGLATGATLASTEAQPPRGTFDYDRDGQVSSFTRPDGRLVDMDYDAGGRLASVVTGGRTTTYAYDPTTGAPTSITGPGGQRIAFTFDGPLPTAQIASGPISGSVERRYDDDLRLRETTVNGASAVAYEYDTDGLLTRAGGLGLTRDPANGDLTATTFGSLATTTTTSAFGELEGLSARYGPTDLYAAHADRDRLGRVSTETETTDAETHVRSYSYDASDRLEDVTRDGQPLARYGYDINGNRNSVTDAAGLTTTASFDSEDRILRQGTITYEHDRAGQRTSQTDTISGQTTTLGYDDLGQLSEVTLPDATQITYDSDPLGRRVARRRNGQLTDAYLYGRGIAPVATLAADGSLKARFVYATKVNVPDYLTRDGNTYRLLTDRLGSVRLVVDTGNGDIAQRLDYDAYGRVTRDSNPGFQPFGFHGGITDPDTGLVHFGAREYDPATGRFLTRDPLGIGGGDSNLYLFAGNDPINSSDPTGLAPRAEPIYVEDRLTAGIDEVGDAIGLTDLADRSSMDYAAMTIDPCASFWTKVGGWTGGLLSSLATKGALGDTVITLATAGIAPSIRAGWTAGRAGKDLIVSRARVPTGGRKWRISPTGHRPNPDANKPPHWGRNLPHYHRRPGIGRHRPWEGGF